MLSTKMLSASVPSTTTTVEPCDTRDGQMRRNGLGSMSAGQVDRTRSAAGRNFSVMRLGCDWVTPDKARCYYGHVEMFCRYSSRDHMRTRTITWEIKQRFEGTVTPIDTTKYLYDYSPKLAFGNYSSEELKKLEDGFKDHRPTKKVRSDIFWPIEKFVRQVSDQIGVGIAHNYLLNEDCVQKLQGLHFRTSHMPDWRCFNFDAMVYVLGCWLSYLTFVPHADVEKLCGRLNVYALADPVSAHNVSNSVVFIAQGINGVHTLPVWSTLVMAANACGVSVYTDHLTMSNDDRPNIKVSSGVRFASNCVEALSILAHVYDLSGYGDVFSVALTAGLHSVATVVGHSDEGGFTRDLLRAVKFSTPFGGIAPGTGFSSGLCGLGARAKYSTLSRWVDSYCLMTAGAVAHCDPLSRTHDGQMCPTIVSSESDNADFRVAENLDLVSETISDFSSLYAKSLVDIFGLVGSCRGDYGAAILVAAFLSIQSKASSANCRHMDYPILAPYFWVEPTCLHDRHQFTTPAETCRLASIGGVGEEYSVPLLNGSNGSPRRDEVTDVTFSYSSPRSMPFFLWLSHDRDCPLVNVYYRQVDPHMLLLSGPQVKDHGASFAAKTPLAAWFWTRGQSQLLHPAEQVNVGGSAMFRIHHYTLDPEFNRIFSPGIPSSFEIFDTLVRFRVTGVSVGGAKKIGAESATLTRIRNRASRTLATGLRMRGRTAEESPPDAPLLACCPAATLQNSSVATTPSKFDKPGLSDINKEHGSVVTEHIQTEPLKQVDTAPHKPVLTEGAQTVPRLPNLPPLGTSSRQAATSSNKGVEFADPIQRFEPLSQQGYAEPSGTSGAVGTVAAQEP